MHLGQILRNIILLLCILLFTGCSRLNQSTLVTTTIKYEWFLQLDIPAGTSSLAQNSPHSISVDQHIHWNNRDIKTSTDLVLSKNGTPASLVITGVSAFGAPIEEIFESTASSASWRTRNETGTRAIEGLRFYVPAEPSVWVLRALVAAAASNGNTVDLLPTGTATVRKVFDAQIESEAGGTEDVSLWMVRGLTFTFHYVWLDREMNLVAFDGGFLSMIREGYGQQTLKTLSNIQSVSKQEAERQKAKTLSVEVNQPLLIENVDLVDVESGELRSNRNVLVVDGKIRDLSSSPIEAKNPLVIDAAGLTMIPGLWDMHGHFGLSQGIVNIAGGITSVRDLGSAHESILKITEAYDTGTVIGPRTYRAGMIDKAGPLANGWPVQTLAEALERVDFFADHGYVQIKLYSSIEPDWVTPIAERTRARGMRLSGHIPAFMSAAQAVRAGYDEIQHINMVFLNFLGGDRLDTRTQLRFTLFGDEGGKLDLDSTEVQAFMELLRTENVVVDPTAAIFDEQNLHAPGKPNPIFAKIINHLPPVTARRLFTPNFDRGTRAKDWEQTAKNQKRMLKLLHDSGIQLVPGSDSMPAFTIHRELELYSEAGIPNADVLRIATIDSARVLGVADSTGSISLGKDADLVLLDGNPLVDISAIRRAKLVIKGATAYQPSELFESVGIKPFTSALNLDAGK